MSASAPICDLGKALRALTPSLRIIKMRKIETRNTNLSMPGMVRFGKTGKPVGSLLVEKKWEFSERFLR